MNTHQYRLRRVDLSLDQRHVLFLGDFVLEYEGAKLADVQRQVGFSDGAHQHLALHAVMDQVLDGDDLESEALGEFHQLRHPCHGAIVVHDLTDDARRRQPRQARQIDGALGLPGAFQDTAGAGAQGEDVTRANQVFGLGLGADGGEDGGGAVGGGNAGGYAAAGFDGYRKRGAEG